MIVLTNNDGCVCALNRYAKALNIPRFAPYFQIKDFCERNNVVVRSSNYALYADLSTRFANILADYSPNSHVYSIDEVFLSLAGMSNSIKDMQQFSVDIRRRIWTELRLPVCVGIGETLTLAKVANHAAKKIRGYNGVCVIKSRAQRNQILTQMDTDEVWGVGSRMAKRRNSCGSVLKKCRPPSQLPKITIGRVSRLAQSVSQLTRPLRKYKGAP